MLFFCYYVCRNSSRTRFIIDKLISPTCIILFLIACFNDISDSVLCLLCTSLNTQGIRSHHVALVDRDYQFVCSVSVCHPPSS